MNKYNFRVLLLGSPGSGKTTTILHLANRLIEFAEENPKVPVPLFVNLSKLSLDPEPDRSGWKFPFFESRSPSVKNEDKRIELWLIEEFTRRYPQVSRENAKKWIQEGRVAALLDGLDEVDDERRENVVTVLNATFFRDYPNSIIVICSRINEYLPLRARKETRVQLNGGITLQPLTPGQIYGYLIEAQAEHLVEVIQQDEALNEMAQTPLTLSMMTLAYGVESAITNLASERTLTQRRHDLMAAYVERMLQRTERRSRRIPFNENRDDDVPTSKYRYSPEQVNRYLGWLALRMSVRMQTVFSPQWFYSFLCRDLERDGYSVWWMTTLSRSSLVVALVLLISCTIAPPSSLAVYITLAIGALDAAGSILSAWLSRSIRGSEIGIGTKSLLTGSIFFATWSVLVIISTAIASVVQGLPPEAACMLVICFGIGGLVSLGVLLDDSARNLESAPLWFVGVTLFAAIIGGVVGWITSSWYVLASALVLAQALWGCCVYSINYRKKISDIVEIVAVITGVVGSIFLGVRIVGNLDWYEALFGVTVPLSIAAGMLRNPQLLITCLVGLFTLGVVINGVALAVISTFGCGYFILLMAVLLATSRSVTSTSVIRYWVTLYELTERFFDRFLFSPMLRTFGASKGYMPISYGQFFDYGEESFLLKGSRQETEFVHRMLRDYFALRKLQPDLNTKNSEQNLEAIRNLGFQGDAGIEALIDFFQSNDAKIRDAAVWAFGHIASPSVNPYIEMALQDKAGQVRITAARSAFNRELENFERQFKLMFEHERDDSILLSLVECLFENVQYRMPISPYGSITIYESPLSNKACLHLLKKIIFSLTLQKIVLSLLQSDNDDVRRNACVVVTDFPDTKAVPALIEILSNTKLKSRATAARALGLIGDRRAVKPLQKVLNDPEDTSVRRAAEESLENLSVGICINLVRFRDK